MKRGQNYLRIDIRLLRGSEREEFLREVHRLADRFSDTGKIKVVEPRMVGLGPLRKTCPSCGR